jgi:hypothetical protein
MGFFDDIARSLLGGGGARRGKGARRSAPPMLEVSVVNAESVEVPEGEREGRIYAYDGRPLRGTRKGSKFRMEVVIGDVDMTSIYTGMETSSLEWEQTNKCVTYGGCAVGYVAGYGSLMIARLVERYGCASIVVRHDGTDEGGWPILTTLMPDYAWFDALLDD